MTTQFTRLLARSVAREVILAPTLLAKAAICRRCRKFPLVGVYVTELAASQGFCSRNRN